MEKKEIISKNRANSKEVFPYKINLSKIIENDESSEVVITSYY
jgi:hypothetical protein